MNSVSGSPCDLLFSIAYAILVVPEYKSSFYQQVISLLVSYGCLFKITEEL